MDLRRTHARSRRGRHVQFALELLEARKLLTIDFQQGFYAVSGTAGAAEVTLVRSDGSSGTANQTTEAAQLTVTGVSATPGVDFEPVSTTVTFGPGQTTQTIAIPVLSDPNSGTKVVRLTLAQSADVPQGAAAYISIMNGPNDTPPTVQATHLVLNRGLVTGFQITFSEPMNVAEVTDVSNYVVGDPATIHRANGKKEASGDGIKLAGATWDASTNTVTLLPAGRVHNARYFEIESTQLAQAIDAATNSTVDVANLSLMSPITDTSGNALDSNSSGIPDGQLLVFVMAGKAGQKWNTSLAAEQASTELLNDI